MRFALRDGTVATRSAVAGMRWWRLGPLTDDELWRVKDMMLELGLAPLGDELRTGKMGPYRSCVYFAAVGEPRCRTRDDGTWGASAAVLQEADPPPVRRTPGTSTAVASSRRLAGPALAPNSSWAGPRASTGVPRSNPVGSSSQAAAPVAATTSVVATGQSTPTAPRRGQRASARATSRDKRQGGARGMEDKLDALLEEMAEMRRQNAALLEEVRELRKENTVLRRELDVAKGRMVHEPYAPKPAVVQDPSTAVDMEVETSASDDGGLQVVGSRDVDRAGEDSKRPLRKTRGTWGVSKEVFDERDDA